MQTETYLRAVLEHPKRVWIITILTLAILLVFAWPAVDSYSAATTAQSAALEKLEGAEEATARLEQYVGQLAKRQAQSLEMEKKLLTPAEIERLRNELIGMIRDAGCTARKIRLSDPITRIWFDEDNPLESKNRNDQDKKSPYRLKTQLLSLAVTGSLPNVHELLVKIADFDKLIHTGGFFLKKSVEDPSVVELELDLMMFDLIPAETKKT